MKKSLLLTLSTVLISAIGLSQGAGNYLMNQKKIGKSYNSSERYLNDGYTNTGYAQQSAYGGSGSYNYIPTSSGYVNDSVIQISTNAMMNVEADSYIAIFGITQIGETVDDGHAKLDERIKGFTNKLKEHGIEEDDIHVDFISQIPVYEANIEKKVFSKSYNEVPAGFEIQKNIHVHVKTEDVVEDILQEAATHEIYDIVKVDYIILDVDAIYDTLRRAAINRINEKAESFKKLGVDYSTTFQTVNENYSSVYPIERYSTYFSFNNAKIQSEARSGDDTRRVSQSDALYYNKVPYNRFEVILNPEEVKPSVQYMYSLTVRYVLKRN